MLAFANAKINLGLNITEKRPDGYHNLETVFYPVRLHDVVELVDSAELSCTVKGIDVPGAAADNLCLKAYRLLQQDFNLPPQHLILLKNIPVGAGLGGGSSDAAFLIKLANEKFGLGLSVPQMEGYARKLGADCAFFISNEPVFAFGKGDEFAPVAVDLSAYFLVLVAPPVHVSTADAFAELKPAVPVGGIKESIHLPVKEWKNHLVNDFEKTIFVKYPQISKVKETLYHSGATFALMSGSGSSVFAIFDCPVALPDLEKENRVFYHI